MDSIMNEENKWDDNVEGDVVQGQVVGCLSGEEVLLALNENRKQPWTIRSIIGVDCS